MSDHYLLIIFVGLYLLISIAVGLYAAKRVKNSTDYVAAGRRLPLYMVIATVFATWFGSETVMGISASFLGEGESGGLRALWSDPFGASLCLILVGLFFARPLYRLNLMTLGDFYRMRYGRTVEVLCSVAIVLSYLGWVSAQIQALGVVFNILSGDMIDPQLGMLLGAGIVLVYTLYGGMWSVALTDFLQMTIIIIGLLYIAWLVADLSGGAGTVIAHAQAAGKFNFLPHMTRADIIAFLAAILTMGFGSIPQQDVFQRVNSAKNAKTAVAGSIIGGSFYLLFAFVPLFIAFSATLIDPALVAKYMAIANPKEGSQQVLPQLILLRTPLLAQIMFFGALLSAIMSTASGTLLAPSVTFSENVLRGTFRNMSDRQFLVMTRVVVVVFSLLVTLYAIKTTESIHAMVENAYKVTLATAFVPLALGLYWKRATTQGAIFSILSGLVVWIALEIVATEGIIPPHFAGMLVGLAAMLLGSLWPRQYIANSHGTAHHLDEKAEALPEGDKK